MSKGWAVSAVILAGWIHSNPAAAQSTGSLPVTARVMSQEAARSYVAARALMGAPLSKSSGTSLSPPQLATVTWAGRRDAPQDAKTNPRIIVVQYLKN
jgi:hypothetical protein